MSAPTIDSLCLNFFHLLARKPNLEKLSIYSSKFFYNFHLSESSFNCPRLWVSGLAWRLDKISFQYFCLFVLIFVYYVGIYFKNVVWLCMTLPDMGVGQIFKIKKKYQKNQITVVFIYAVIYNYSLFNEVLYVFVDPIYFHGQIFIGQS